jgi:glycosyltransferase involved in cell wall biosynthesis
MTTGRHATTLAPVGSRTPRVALLLSTDTFESFFEGQLKLTRDEYLNDWRGGWVWSYCRMLRIAGLDPVIYIASLTYAGRHETPDGFTVRFLPLRRWYRLWHSIPRLKRSPPGRYLAEIANGVALLTALRDALAKDGVDLLHIQEYWTGRYDFLALVLDVPFVAAHQGLTDRRQVKLAKRWTLARALRVTTQTRAEADKVARYGIAAIPIPNAVDSTFFVPEPNHSNGTTRTVLCVARLADEHKRQSDLIRALARLPEPWRLQLVGTGPDRERLGALARTVGVEPRVEFVGFVGGKAELRRHLQACDVFALVSRREGMPVALLEAMSCGAPVVGTDIAGVAEALEDGVSGLLVPVGQPERIARRIEEAYARRHELGREARLRIEREYSEDTVGARLAEIVRLAARPAAGPVRGVAAPGPRPAPTGSGTDGTDYCDR